MNTLLEYLEITAKAAGFSEPKSLPEIAGAIIGTALSLLGIVFLCLIIYAGFMWMTSLGNELKVRKAKETLVSAVIGLIIVLGSYSITLFIFSAFQEVVR